MPVAAKINFKIISKSTKKSKNINFVSLLTLFLKIKTPHIGSSWK